MTVQELKDLIEYGLVVGAVIASQWGLLAAGVAAA